MAVQGNPSTQHSDAEHATSSSRYSLPLFDPHGLGSPSNAEREDIQSSKVEKDGSASHMQSGQASTSSLFSQPLHFSRRGRRRRSSQSIQLKLNAGSGDDSSTEESNSLQGVAEPLLWWQRPKHDGVSLQNEKYQEATQQGQPILTPLDTKHNTELSSSPTPSVRSPAAAFLMSMNETLGSPSSQSGSFIESERGYSVSPIRNSSQVHRMSMPIFNALQGTTGESAIGLTSAATQMLGASETSERQHTSALLRPDDEGSTIGPHGRYLLGKIIGFGGFSTIREAWDMGLGAKERTAAKQESLRRIAVKIVYSSDEDHPAHGARENEELQIWETIPAHPNLLPLLHHERIVVDQSAIGESKKKQAISFLVMPYCEGSLLAYVKSEGSLPDKATASPTTPALSRSGSLKGNKTPFQQYEATLRQNSAYPRTGSGFVNRSAGVRVASVPLSSIFNQSPSSNSSLLRRGSSRISRGGRQTNGVPFKAARVVMQQVTEALICLHKKAGIVHGDLKLENVLGQRSISRTFHTWGKEKYNENVVDSDGEDNNEVSSLVSICWRVADFGLARRVQTNSTQYNAEMQERASRARKGKTTVGGAGGSLAYTAPELFMTSDLGDGSRGEEGAERVSPFASDMWALGCIFYVLCSGKLPFSDSFEPRLQMKIAKGAWEMPPRLRRCNERKNNSNPLPNFNMNRERSSSGYMASESLSRTSSFSSSFAAYKPSAHSLHTSPGSSTVMDMSASMPALQERRFFENGEERSFVDHSSGEASYFVEEKEDSSTESDDDEQLDREMDGTSRDRVSIRQILRNLLEPDPRKRWKIEQLASHAWILEDTSTAFSGIGEGTNANDYSSTMQNSFSDYTKRPSLAHPTISEHTSQETTSTFVNREAEDAFAGDSDTAEDDYGRGRTIRRERLAKAKPIDIDRSSSRSHSRPRLTRIDSSPWEKIESSFERSLQMAGPWEEVPRRSRLQRSSSADTHGIIRGRSTTSSKERRSVSRPPRLEGVNTSKTTEHSPAPPTSTSAQGSDWSASRSSTSRSRSRARDTLYEIASRNEAKEPKDDRLWWQQGLKNAR